MAVGQGATDLSKTLSVSLPPMADIWKLITEKLKEAGEFFSSTWDKVKESPVVKQVVEYAEEGVNVIAPYVKKGVDYSVEKIQQHPYLASTIALLLFWVFWCKCCRCSGGRRGGKMMKAPGADYMMLRADFESSPKSYFRGLRGKSLYDGTQLV